MTPPVDPKLRAQWDLMHELRDSPKLLQEVAGARGSELALQKQLRRRYSDRLVSAAFSLCELRRLGAAKFTRASEMWFDRQGFEQATSEAVAGHKAKRFQGSVLDLCCGIGADSLALAQHSIVTAVDSNPIACLRTIWNAEVYSVASRIETRTGDANEAKLSDSLVHIDPDRRSRSAARSIRVEDYEPGLDFLRRLCRTARGGAIKLSPAANFGGKFRDVEIELVSLAGECKEATVWFGELRGEESWRATVLPSVETLAGEPLDESTDLSRPLRYVFDPDPAVVRAGLVDLLAARFGLFRLDAAEEYLTGDEPASTGFLHAFEIVAELPNSAAEIRRYFRGADFGQVEIKCRHIPVDATAVRRKLELSGSQPAVLIFARISGKARVLVCRRVEKKTRRQGERETRSTGY